MTPGSVEELERIDGKKIFTITPLYALAKVDFNILERISDSVSVPLNLTNYLFDFNILDLPGIYGRIIHAVDKDAWDETCLALIGACFVNYERNEFWTVVRANVVVEDPFVRASKSLHPVSCNLTVFLPSGNKVSYYIEEEVEPNSYLRVARIKSRPPVPTVVELSKGVL